jgi:hypothetical protein
VREAAAWIALLFSAGFFVALFSSSMVEAPINAMAGGGFLVASFTLFGSPYKRKPEKE